jgi:VWFA-related protein
MRNGRNGQNRTGLGWLGAALAVTISLACAAPAAAQTFAGATDVVEVEVPVQVVKDGQPVRGLSAADFEVYDGRKKQAITGFHVVDLAAPAAARAAAVPLAGRRQFLLMFDLAFSDPKSVVGARDAARDLVIKGLRPGDLVGVATYSAARGPQIVLGFTSDRRQVDSALETLGLTSGSGQPSDPLRLVLAPLGKGLGKDKEGDQRQLAGRSLEADAASTGALLTRDILGPQLAEMNKETGRSDQKAAVTALTRSYTDLARLLGSMPGRKQIVYFSEGFDGSLLTGNAGTSSLIEGGGRDVTSDPALASTDDSYGSTRTVNDVEKMLEELRRADCVIQAVDTGGLRAAGEQRGGARVGGKDSLLTMAKGTGGELYQSSNDLTAGVGAILERTSLTYVLSFQPEKAKTAGEYRKIKVELKGAARGARLAYRSGYYAPRPYPQLNPLEKLFEASSRLMGGAESGSIGSAVLAAPFRAPGELAWVPVLIEVDGPTLLAGKPQGPLPVEIYVYALDAAGAIQDFLFQQLGMDLAKVEPAIRQTGLKFFGHLELPAGEYSVRTLVRNGTSGAFSLRVSPLTVPDFAAGPVLLPPLFPEPAGRWLMTRESPRGAQVPYPFMAKQQPYIPASRPALAEGSEVPLALVGYNLGPGSLKAEARVLTLDGKEAGTGAVRVLERESGGGSGPDRLSAAFTPPRLAPGEYVLRVTVSGEAGSAGASSAPFVVGAASTAPPASPPASH